MWKIFSLSLFCIIQIIYGFCSNRGCFLNGKTYTLNSKVQLGCFVFQCLNNTWQFRSINISCASPLCTLCNDPHFTTFDGHKYDFQRSCNYTISQPVDCCNTFSSYFPPYGIFGDFVLCNAGAPGSTCLDLTTYKISNDLSIQIKHAPTLSLVINGISVTPSYTPIVYYGCSSLSPAIIWRSGKCIYIAGTYYTIHACYECMYIYTVPAHMNRIAGLCGFYSGKTSDEYRLRNCSYKTFGNEIPFGEDWKTIDQREKECRGCQPKVFVPPICKSDDAAYSLCSEVINNAPRKCPYGYSQSDVSEAIANCVEDCCSTGFKNCQRWANVGLEYLCKLSELSNITRTE